ncbi:MAG: hypothetical protein NTW85_10015 [Methylococcales bacterium]|nr:hypothetical protein [Methylococcales bacterium]
MALFIETETVKNSLLSIITKTPTAIVKFFIDHWSLRPLFYLFSIVYVILSMHLPVSIYTGAIYDDALYWSNARLILGGHWLGDYSQMTLAKGAGFPLFLAINGLIGIPITLAIALFYLFSCGLLAKTLRVLGVNKYIVLILFFATLLHPELFPTHITRDNIYPALLLIIISGIIKLVFTPQQQDMKLKNIIPYGLAFGLFWITREEGTWIIPSLFILVLLRVMQLKQQKLPIKEVTYRFAFFSLVAIAFVSLIGLTNYGKYGKFEVVDFKGEAYSQALKNLNSVDVGQDLPYIPVSFAKRQVIYKISPSFAQLKELLEDKAKIEATAGCALYSWTCGDYAGEFFDWALRDAVANKGYYQTPVLAAEFYNNITKEIATACDSGAIKCRTNPLSFMPNITLAQLQTMPEKISEAIKLAMVQLPIAATGGASEEPLDQLQRVRLFLGNPSTIFAPIEQRTILTGWFYSTTADWIVLNCSVNGITVKKEIDRIDGHDITETVKNPTANHQGFLIDVSDYDNCSIAIDTSPSKPLLINSLVEQQDTTLGFGEKGIFHIEHIYQSYIYNDKYAPSKLKKLLGKLYKLVMPIIVPLGAFIYLIYFFLIVVKKIPITDIFIISTLIWCLFISRIFITVLVDISSFATINATYMLAAFPVLCLAAFLSLQLIFFKKDKI